MAKKSKKQTGTTHVLLVVDRSGSMSGSENDVIGGINGYVDGLRGASDSTFSVTLALFDHEYVALCAAAPLDDVPAMSHDNYRVRGTTALRDAIGKTILEFEERVRTLGEDDKVLLVVNTDGEENSSREITAERVRQMITEREASGKWACVFLGADMDAWATSAGMGFARGQSVSMAKGAVMDSYAVATASSISYASGATDARDVGDAIKRGLDEKNKKQ